MILCAPSVIPNATQSATAIRKVSGWIRPEDISRALFAIAIRLGSAIVVEKPILKAKIYIILSELICVS